MNERKTETQFDTHRKVDSISAEVKSILLVEIWDKGPKGEFLGCFEIVINNIADNIQREEWFTLQRKKKKV